MAAGQSRLDIGLDIGLGVHPEPVSPAISSWSRENFPFAFASAVAISLRRNDFMEGCG
jgi:hypothetical protein